MIERKSLRLQKQRSAYEKQRNRWSVIAAQVDAAVALSKQVHEAKKAEALLKLQEELDTQREKKEAKSAQDL